MFQPFTGVGAGDDEAINALFNKSGFHTNPQECARVLRESVEDLEYAFDGVLGGRDIAITQDELTQRIRSAVAFLNNPYWKKDREDFLRVWERALCRKWHQHRCAREWRGVLDAFYEATGLPTAGRDDTQATSSLAETGLTYRILFPTAKEKSTETGWLAWAVIRVVSPRPNESVIKLVPWSFFLWDANQTRNNLGKLETALPAALKASGLATEEVDRLQFLIELAPLRTSDSETYSRIPKVEIDALCPPFFEIAGNSLDLAVAIAAWAAHTKTSVVPLVATGELQQDGRIRSVGGIRSKCRAFEQLRSHITNLQMLLPLDCDATGYDQPPIRFVQTLQQHVFRSGLLTDGLDEYCRECGADHNPNPAGDSTSDGLRLNELTPFDDLLNSKDLPFDLPAIALPFNESPKPVALWFADQCTAKLSKQADGNPNDRTVAIPLSLKNLFDLFIENTADKPANWPDLFTRAIQKTQLSLAGTNNAEALSIALCKPNKLVFVAYDDPSCALWTRLGVKTDGEFQAHKQYQQFMADLRLLCASEASTLGGRLAPQRLLVICSDQRHQLMWDEANQVAE